jgi:ribosomal protein S12 methylthiotransferase
MQQAAAPKVSFVSLGCPKALVDSERIITRLRAEGYELARKHDGADIVIVNTCGFLDSAKQESLGAIGEAMAENGKVIVTGCMGAEPEQIEAAYPGVLSITGPQQYESVLEAVHRALPPVHQADAAALRLFEDFGRLQQPLQLLHHSKAARRPGVAPGQ